MVIVVCFLRSYIDLSPVNNGEIWLLKWIGVGWIVETALWSIFLIEVLLNSLSNSDKVDQVLGVVDVGVKVVLEVLEHVHVFLDEFVSADSWERKSLIIEFPGVNESLHIWLSLLGHVLHDFKSILEILDIEFSGEVLHFFFELGSGEVESFFAWAVVEGILRLTLRTISTHSIVTILVEGDSCD